MTNACASSSITIGMLAFLTLASAQTPAVTAPGAAPAVQTAAAAPRPTPPTRDPNTPGFVTKKELPDGAVPPADANGNFVIGPTHTPAPELAAPDTALQGTVHDFTMSPADSKIYPGIARDAGTFGTVDPADPAKLLVTTSRPAPYTRRVAVYVPKQYVPGTAAPSSWAPTVPTRRCSRRSTR